MSRRSALFPGKCLAHIFFLPAFRFSEPLILGFLRVEKSRCIPSHRQLACLWAQRHSFQSRIGFEDQFPQAPTGGTAEYTHFGQRAYLEFSKNCRKGGVRCDSSRQGEGSGRSCIRGRSGALHVGRSKLQTGHLNVAKLDITPSLPVPATELVALSRADRTSKSEDTEIIKVRTIPATSTVLHRAFPVGELYPSPRQPPQVDTWGFRPHPHPILKGLYTSICTGRDPGERGSSR